MKTAHFSPRSKNPSPTHKIKLFVFSDNLFILQNATKIFDRYDLDVKYFCSPKSSAILENFPSIYAKELKNSYEDLLDFDLGFSLHSRQIFPEMLVKNVQCINLHPGFNPYNKGIFPHIFSLINKLPTGATLHIMDHQIDNGNIIDQIQIIPQTSDTSLSLYQKIQEGEIALLEKNLPNILEKNFSTKTPAKGNYNSKKDFENLCKIDLTKTLTFAQAIDYLKALSHPPYHNAYFIDENQNKIYVSLQLIANNSMGGGALDSPCLNPSLASHFTHPIDLRLAI
ncbi:dTDP-4-amino-4,6-dideoxyglucose formyltransferase [Helicobacter sp. 11S02596-1]|uniref:dTDP-4-amino-4,6-dideoxyglucose formyltransferase n=1 Tax=Helicobacter sp. 11S02596-1 TaxID=1476194 RepID=UPI000BA71441|nr:dTDP-4-amino-4,6-dideoxyglucose formyltransferase [Helicobacter sp. 11S02596-1]PAF45158.1 hypothetical protein BJI48_00915 [Helicobacter sp. 11S02596-1]